jgi:dTDP-4-amino-4,6-dideoxygalactose transaminase
VSVVDDQYRVPRSRSSATHQTMRQEILDAIEPILFESAMHGYAVRAAFEERFAAAVDHRSAVAVHSGTIGLYVGLRACGVGPGDEVVTVGNSDVSTTAAISLCGAQPVLCEVLERDYTLDVDAVEACLTPRTRAIMPVDLYGHPSDVARLRELADAHGLRIVEDAALATGARDHGRPVGAFADATIFSFAPFKPLGSTGNGAVVASHDPDIARRVRLLAGYGHAPDVRDERPGHQAHVDEGLNVPLDPLQAAILMVKLPHLERWTVRRNEVVARYRQGLDPTRVRMPVLRPESEPTFRSFTVLVEHQAQVYQALRDAGVDAVLHYAPPVYQQPVYRSHPIGASRLPVTEFVASHLICLPVTPELIDAEIDDVCDVVNRACAGGWA